MQIISVFIYNHPQFLLCHFILIYNQNLQSPFLPGQFNECIVYFNGHKLSQFMGQVPNSGHLKTVLDLSRFQAFIINMGAPRRANQPRKTLFGNGEHLPTVGTCTISSCLPWYFCTTEMRTLQHLALAPRFDRGLTVVIITFLFVFCFVIVFVCLFLLVKG